MARKFPTYALIQALNTQKRQNYAKGGAIKRQYFDAGGIANPNSALSNVVTGGYSGALATGISAANSAVQGIASDVGGAVSGIENSLGLNDSYQGNAANIQQGTNAGQLNQAYNQAQTGLSQQQQFAGQAAAQNGLSNQSQVYNQLAGVASGQGPNPAQAQLANATGANVSNQAALMAGQEKNQLIRFNRLSGRTTRC